jgi:hypothetical protein
VDGRLDAEAVGIPLRHDAPVTNDDDRVSPSQGLAVRLREGPVERRLQACLGRRDDLGSRDVGQEYGDRPIDFYVGAGRYVGRLRPIQIEATDTVPVRRDALETAQRPRLDLALVPVHLVTQSPVESAEDRIADDVFPVDAFGVQFRDKNIRADDMADVAGGDPRRISRPGRTAGDRQEGQRRCQPESLARAQDPS